VISAGSFYSLVKLSHDFLFDEGFPEMTLFIPV